MLKRAILMSVVLVMTASFFHAGAQAPNDEIPPSYVLKAVIQNVYQLTRKQVKESDIQPRAYVFNTMALDCYSPEKGEPVLPAHLSGYVLDVPIDNNTKLSYHLYRQRLFLCENNQPGPDIRLAVPDTNVPPFLAEPPTELPFPVRGSAPVVDTDRTIRHEAARYGYGTLHVASYSPDGSNVAIGGSLGIWLLSANLQPIAHLIGDTFQVTALVWSPTGEQIATADLNQAVQLWDVASGNVRTLDVSPQYPKSGDTHGGGLCYNPDGTRLASASPNGIVKIWDTRSGRKIFSIRTGGEVYAVAWAQDGKRLAVSGAAGRKKERPMAEVYDVVTGRQLGAYKVVVESADSPVAPIQQIQWLPDGKRLAIVPPMGDILNPVVWDVGTGETEPLYVTIPCGSIATGFYLSPDGAHYAVGIKSCEEEGAAWAEIHNIAPDMIPMVPAGMGSIRAMAWTPDGKQFLMLRGDNGITVYDLEQIKREDQNKSVFKSSELFGKIDNTISPFRDDYSFSYPDWEIVDPYRYGGPTPGPDGKLIAALGWHDVEQVGEVVLIDSRTAQVAQTLHTLPDAPLQCGDEQGAGGDYGGGPGGLMCRVFFEWSPDGTLLKGSDSAHVYMWDVRTGNNLYSFSASDAVTCAWGVESRFLLCGLQEKPYARHHYSSLYVLDARTGQRLRTIQDKVKSTLQWAPAQHGIVLIEDNHRIQLWNETFDRLLLDVPGKQVGWSRDALHIVVVEGPGALTLYDTASGNNIASLKGTQAETLSAVFSPNDRFLGASFANGEIDIWNTQSGQRLFRLVGHRGPTYRIVWNDDSTQLMSSGSDGTTRLWSLK